MSYTAVASRSDNRHDTYPGAGNMPGAPRGDNFNLNIFSHPPVKAEAAEPSYTQAFSYPKPVTPTSAPFSDDDDIFDLDMVTMDMDFEQAYSMYSQLQQKNALSEVEQLQRAQQANPWRRAGSAREHATSSVSMPVPVQPQPRRLHQSVPDVFQYDFSFTPKSDQFAADAMGLNELQLKPEVKAEHKDTDTDLDDSVEDADQFFSNTESDALQKFLDNLAYSSQVNPLDLYSKGKKDLDVFKHHPGGVEHKPEQLQEQRLQQQRLQQLQQQEQMYKQRMQEQMYTQRVQEQKRAVPTPPDSAAEEEPKKRRKTGKPLLSLAQKRLNHSHSEQKRRMLCKDAYERCLRLITNVDDYRNDLVSARSVASSKKKSKRRQLNKAGLPNLSKHSALMKISAEIEKIQKKNDLLRSLAGVNSI